MLHPNVNQAAQSDGHDANIVGQCLNFVELFRVTWMPLFTTGAAAALLWAGGRPGVDSGEALLDLPFLQWDCYGAKGNYNPDYEAAYTLASTLVEEAYSLSNEEHGGGHMLRECKGVF